MIDLHVHTTMSDGTYTPSGIAKLAKERGVEAFSVTDHDIVEGTDEAAAAAKELGIDFINGMEMSTGYQGRQLHIVCLGFDRESPAFKELYARLRDIKEGDFDRIIEFIRGKGVDISREKVEKYVTVRPGRYAIMRYMVDVLNTTNIQYIWDNYVNAGVQSVGNDYDLPVEEGLALIKQAGGVTSLAHFHKKIGLKTFEKSEREGIIKHLVDCGLDGMERYYPNYSQEDNEFAAYMIEKYNMLPTGGTDFHGGNRATVLLGTGTDNNMNVPYSYFQAIRAKVGK